MRTVLIVAYYFPPSGGPGVQRVLKFVQYLREFGWRPVVLTVKDGTFPARDESLLQLIPADVEVIRTDIFEPYDLYRTFTGKSKSDGIDVNTLRDSNEGIGLTERLSEFIRATFFIPDARIGWRRHAVKAGVAACRRLGIDAIYSSSPPYTCSLIARDIKRKTGLPWIAGFRDPWTGFLTTPDRWFIPAAIDIGYERSVFTEADAVDVAWEGIRDDALRKFPTLPHDKFHYLPNGYDSADIPGDVDPSHRTERFTVTYTGSMYGIRTPREFLDAVAGLIRSSDVDPQRIRLRFIGRFGDEIHAMFASFIAQEAVDVVGYVPHDESIRALFEADALLLVVDTAPESADIVPGKVFEYIGTGKPVIAVAPETGAVASLIRETESGFVAHQENGAGIASAFLTLYRAWKDGATERVPQWEKIRRYERRTVTRDLARLLDEVVERRGVGTESAHSSTQQTSRAQ